MAAQKQRRTAAAPVGTLEALRNKQCKLQEEELSFHSYRDMMSDNLKKRENELLEKEVEFVVFQ